MLIRPADIDDFSLLAQYWYDNIALLQQYNPRIRLAPNPKEVWDEWAFMQFYYEEDDEEVFWVAEADGVVQGYIYGIITDNEVGLLPKQIGVVKHLIVDIHSKTQRGAGSALWYALRTHFINHDITTVRIATSASSAVMQAFWRGIGAKKTDELFWITL